MVAFRYEKWDEDLLRRMKEFASLMAVFQHLLLQANGDVERTLQYMKRLQEMGYLDKNADLTKLMGGAWTASNMPTTVAFGLLAVVLVAVGRRK